MPLGVLGFRIVRARGSGQALSLKKGVAFLFLHAPIELPGSFSQAVWYLRTLGRRMWNRRLTLTTSGTPIRTPRTYALAIPEGPKKYMPEPS